MRCIYCGFQNMEGAATCSSCQRSLSNIVISQPGGLAAILAAANATSSQQPIPTTVLPESGQPETAPLQTTERLETEDEVDLPNWMSGAPPPPPTPWATFDIDALASASTPQAKKPKRGHLDLETLLPANADSPAEVFAEAVRRQKRKLPRLWFQVKKQSKSPTAKQFDKRTRFTNGEGLTPVGLASSDFVCPRCRKVRADTEAVIVHDSSGATRRVCYRCAHEIKDATAALSKVRTKDWLPGFIGGLVVGLICAALIFGITSLTRLSLLKALVLVGFLVGGGTRIGANNRHGLALSIIAVGTTILAYWLCMYAGVAAVTRGGLPDFSEFLAALPTLQFGIVEWLSALLGLVMAFVTPYGPLNILRKR